MLSVKTFFIPMYCISLVRAISKCAAPNNKLSYLFVINSNKGVNINNVNKFQSKINYSQLNTQNENQIKSRSVRNYAVAIAIMTLGLTYAAVPLYGIFCQMTGYGGTTKQHTVGDLLKDLQKNTKKKIKVKFNSDLGANMAWKFRPQQNEIEVYPGETALAFYTATNPTDKPIIGVSTYNVIPFDAGPYFNKIQCFCFEEQILNPHEQVDMPVFFYIDPEFSEDPKMEFIDEIILSYTFFEAKEGLKIPIPEFLKQK